MKALRWSSGLLRLLSLSSLWLGLQGLGLAAAVEPLPWPTASPYPGALALSADGRIAAHVDGQGHVQVWDALTAQPLAAPPAGTVAASAVALSPDGRWLAVGQVDGRLWLWSRADLAQPPHELRGHSGRLLAVAFSPDAQRLASGSADGTSQLFDVATGRRLQVLDSVYNGHASEGVAAPVAVGFAAGGRLLLTHDWQRRQYDVGRMLSLWDAQQGLEITTQEVSPPNGDQALQPGHAVGAGGWLLAYTGADRLMLQRLDGCTAPRPVGTGGYADTVAVDPQGRWVAQSQGDALVFHRVAAGGAPAQLPLPGRALALAPLADGRTLLAVLDTQPRPAGPGMLMLSPDAPAATPARLFRIAVPAPLVSLPPLRVAADAQPCPVSDGVRRRQQFNSPEGLAPLAVTARLTPALPPLAGEEPQPLGPVAQLRFDPHGQVLALYLDVGDTRPGVNLWSLATGRTVLARAIARQREAAQPLWLGMDWAVYDRENNLVRATTGLRLLGSPEGRGWLGAEVTADAETGRLYRITGAAVEQVAADGRRLPAVPVRRAGGAKAGAGDGISGIGARNGRLLVAYRNGDMELFGGAPLASVLFRPAKAVRTADAGDEAVERLMLSADGRYAQALVDASNSETPASDVAWRLADGKPLGTGSALAELPGGASRVVTTDTRGHRLAVWDFDQAEPVARLPRQRSRDANGNVAPLKAAISDDGRRVASASPDGLVRVWDIESHALLGEARVGAAVTALAFDAPGRQLAVGRVGGQVWLLALP